VQRISLTGILTQSVRSSNTNVLDSPCLLVLNTGTSQSRQHVIYARQSYTQESMEYSEASHNCCTSQWYGILEQAEQLELLVDPCGILYDNMK
ncbi:hypothetical protein Tco_1455516, partial [Tanacetum coccineum]